MGFLGVAFVTYRSIIFLVLGKKEKYWCNLQLGNMVLSMNIEKSVKLEAKSVGFRANQAELKAKLVRFRLNRSVSACLLPRYLDFLPSGYSSQFCRNSFHLRMPI